MFSRFNYFIHSLLQQPSKLFLFGVLLTIILMSWDGSLWKYWNLQKSQQAMEERMALLEAKSKKLEFKIHQANKLTYIERQATDQFDYVREGDLIFVFSE